MKFQGTKEKFCTKLVMSMYTPVVGVCVCVCGGRVVVSCVVKPTAVADTTAW